MVSQGRVFQSTEGKQNVYYYPNKSVFDLERDLESRIDYHISLLQQKFEKLKEQYDKLSQDKQVTAFSSLSTLLFCLEMKMSLIDYGISSTNFVRHKIGEQYNQVNRLSDDIMNFITAQPEHLKILNNADTRFGLLALELEKEFDLLLSEDKKE
ncbi:MAG: hypothetical protein KGI07_09565 [Thaumarchaeota archaeon]|nr:hypothetical protein [Nitrososphaerota archaeon]